MNEKTAPAGEAISIDDAPLLTMLAQNGYTHVRKLPDGTCAGLYKLLYTVAICTGMDWHGWAYRYCFDDADLALSELQKLENMDDEPTGFIARRYGDVPAPKEKS